MIEHVESEPDARQPDNPAAPSFAELLGDLRNDTVTLIKREFDLAKVETIENMRHAGVHIVLVIAGALVACAGGVVMLLCAAALIAWGFLTLGASAAAAAALGLGCAGACAAAGGVALLYYGGQKLRDHPILPESTIENFKQDARCIQQGLL
ncbi:MAG: putative phage tail protein [Verrucomicrobiales bacterium]|jgi:predicted phage tail protein